MTIPGEGQKAKSGPKARKERIETENKITRIVTNDLMKEGKHTQAMVIYLRAIFERLGER